MAMTDVYQSHPGLRVDNQEWQTSQLQAAAGAMAESRKLSTTSAFISAPMSLPAASYNHLSSTAGIANQAQPQQPPQRIARRRGCQHCITCSGLQHHCHSTTVRSSYSPAAEWWPGGIQSPAVYYHLRAKQLSYAEKFPRRSGASWRSVSEVHTGQSNLLARRNQGPMAVLVPAVYTNVSPNEAQIQYLGDKVVPLRKPMNAEPHQQQQQQQQPAIVPTPPPKRGLEAPLRSARSTWSHPGEPETVLGTRRSSSSGSAGFGFYTDPKRRCTEQKGQQQETATPVHPGHFIARSTPYTASSAHWSPPVFPGVVLQHYTLNNGPTSNIPVIGGGGIAQQPLPILGVVTPPLGTMAPLSAGSDASASSIVPMSEGSGSGSGSDYGWSAHNSASMPTHAAAVWEMTSSVSSRASDPMSMPVLMHNMRAPVSEDPTLQQYYARQYIIKQEQAFPCHQVIEMGVGGGIGNESEQQQQQQQQQQQEYGWTSMLKSLAGSLKKTLSP